MYRTSARELAMQLSFAAVVSGIAVPQLLRDFLEEEHYATLAAEDPLYEEYPDEAQLPYIRAVVGGTVERREELDGYIGKYAVNWKLGRISRVAVSILRVAMFEILYLPEVPYRAAANEAVELAKAYEGRDVASFVNGILSSFIAAVQGEAAAAPAAEEAPAPAAETAETAAPEAAEETEAADV